MYSAEHSSFDLSHLENEVFLASLGRKRLLLWAVGLILLCAVVASCWAIYWNPYSPVSATYYAKRLFNVATYDDHLRHGAVCNAKQKYPCALDAFKKAMHLNRKSGAAVASYGMILTKMKRHSEAIDVFKYYKKMGYQSYDASYFMARSYYEMGMVKAAERHCIKSTNLNPNFRCADMILRIYNNENKIEESLAYLRSLESESPELFSNFQSIATISMKAFSKLDPKPRLLTLPQVGLHYYVPLKFENSSVGVFLVDTGASYLTMSYQMARMLKIKVGPMHRSVKMRDANGRLTNGSLHDIAQLKVGTMVAKKVRLVLCDKCSPLAGQSLLNKFQLSTKNRGGVSYLTVTK